MIKTITITDILNRLERKVQVIKAAIENRDVSRLREECVCSLICGDEYIITDAPVLDNDFGFEYKGYKFELTPCTMLVSKQQVLDTADEFRRGGTRAIFTDRYVCWMFGHKDNDGHTLKEYLKLNQNETEQNNCWVQELYLVPDAWAWGAESDCNPGDAVDKLILDKIDEFLEKNPDL